MRSAPHLHPVPVWAPLVGAALLSVVLAVVVLVVVRPPGPLDQADPADQRNGLLLDGLTVQEEVGGVRFGGEPMVLLFVRQAPSPQEVQTWVGELPAGTVVTVVVQDPGGAEAAGPPATVATVLDPDRVLAAAVDLPEPLGGGPGIGYAVVDSDRAVRYSTLDPAWRDNGFEVATIVGSVS